MRPPLASVRNMILDAVSRAVALIEPMINGDHGGSNERITSRGRLTWGFVAALLDCQMWASLRYLMP